MKSIKDCTLLVLLLMAGGVTMQAQNSKSNRELPEQYWVDLVTEQPEGYVVDANGNVHIYSAEALTWISVVSNGFNGQEIDNFEGRTVSLEVNVNMAAAIWTPISERIDMPPFKGSFDGKEHIIDGLQLTGPNPYADAGFFGNLFEASLSNIVIRNGYFEGEGGYDTGFLAAQVVKSRIDHCFVNCEIHGGRSVPFVFSNNGSIITNCLAYCPLLQNGNQDICGAFVAESRLYNGDGTLPTIRNCAAIIEKMDWPWGESCGFVGWFNHGLIENCYVYIHEILNFPGYGGGSGLGPRNGITRDNMGEVYNCYYNRIRNFDPAFSGYYMQLDDSPGEGGNFYDTSPFIEEGRGHWKLTEEITFEHENGTVSTNDLLDALNFKVQLLDDEVLLEWCDTGMGFDNRQLPVFCDFDVTQTSDNATSLDQVEVYPNPARETVTIEGIEAAEVQVYNALGQLVKSVRWANEVDFGELVEGVYLVRITDKEGNAYSERIVKE